MNLGELIGLYRFRADDRNESQPLVSRADLVLLFNEAEREAAERAGLLIDAARTYAVTAGQSTVTTGADIADIRHAQLTDASGAIIPLRAVDRTEMDRLNPNWRTVTGQPSRYIREGDTLTLTAIPEQDYTLALECRVYPSESMSDDADSPLIAPRYHRNLVDWVLYRVFDRPDVDIMNPGAAERALMRFERHFGRRKPAKELDGNRARPHRNKLW